MIVTITIMALIIGHSISAFVALMIFATLLLVPLVMLYLFALLALMFAHVTVVAVILALLALVPLKRTFFVFLVPLLDTLFPLLMATIVPTGVVPILTVIIRIVATLRLSCLTQAEQQCRAKRQSTNKIL